MRCIEMCFILSFSYKKKSLSQAKCFILKTPLYLNTLSLKGTIVKSAPESQFHCFLVSYSAFIKSHSGTNFKINTGSDGIFKSSTMQQHSLCSYGPYDIWPYHMANHMSHSLWLICSLWYTIVIHKKVKPLSVMPV